MSDSQRVAVIVFVDICGSTPLYERSGDHAALDAIAGTLDALRTVVLNFHGQVVRSKGDDLLCTFTDPTAALDAASDMLQAASAADMSLRIGMHHGVVLPAFDDIFGDAVNVAARMLSMAKPGEILSTETLVLMLPARERERLTHIGKQFVKGKEQPIKVYSLVHDDGASTLLIAADTLAERHVARASKTFVILEHRGERRVVRPGHTDLRLGRSPRSDLVINASSVSREHATVRVTPGRVSLTDHSSAGSWITIGIGEDAIAVKRETVPLSGDGVIFLGYPPGDDHAPPCIGFSVQGVDQSNEPRDASDARHDDAPRSRSVERVAIPAFRVMVFKGDNATGLRAEITNVSARGAKLISEHRLGEAGQVLHITPLSGATSLTCELRFTRLVTDELNDAFAHGVMFTDLDDTGRRALRDMLQAQGVGAPEIL